MSLRKIAAFYEGNADVIDAHRIPTLDFATGVETTLRYTRAKVIDMVFFIEGGYTGWTQPEDKARPWRRDTSLRSTRRTAAEYCNRGDC